MGNHRFIDIARLNIYPQTLSQKQPPQSAPSSTFVSSTRPSIAASFIFRRCDWNLIEGDFVLCSTQLSKN
jgi:hypothetical protein